MSNYFAILPAEIRYHKELSFGEKILYAEITACADENEICTATNEHFSGAFDKSVKWVSNSLTSLKQYGCIDVSISKSKGNFREIHLLPMEKITPVTENINDNHATEFLQMNVFVENALESNFEVIWSAYPNHEERDRAKTAFAEISPDTDTLERILTDIEIRRNSDEWQGGNIPYLCNYLSKRKWECCCSSRLSQPHNVMPYI